MVRRSTDRPSFQPSPSALRTLYEALRRHYGEQPWWPADSPFEVAVGAVLTQNAAWSNVERAIERLKSQALLTLPALLEADDRAVAEAIRPSGYYNIKAQRLHNLCRFLAANGGLEGLANWALEDLRNGLLEVQGIGPETADDILLYAFHRPVFVIDAYTRRLLKRVALARGDETYEALRLGFEQALGPDVGLYQQYHALIVMHAKAACRKSPACPECVLLAGCPTGQAS